MNINTTVLMLEDTSTPMITFISVTIKCLQALLTKAPTALIPVGAVEGTTMVVANIASRLLICHPKAKADINAKSLPKSNGINNELEVLCDVSMSYLSYLFNSSIGLPEKLCEGDIQTGDREERCVDRADVVCKVVHNLISSFQLCDEVSSTCTCNLSSIIFR